MNRFLSQCFGLCPLSTILPMPHTHSIENCEAWKPSNFGSARYRAAVDSTSRPHSSESHFITHKPRRLTPPSKGPPTAASYCSTSTKITGTLHEDVFTFINISRSYRLRMRNVSNKSCRENQNKHFMLSFFFSENRVVREIMSKNIHPEWLQTIWHLRVACWISKATRA